MIKKVLFTIMTLFWALSLSAQNGVKWENGSIEDAIKKASRQNKYIFIDCYTKWCKPCRYMEQNVFTTNEAGEYFNKKFINYKMDMEVGDGLTYVSKYYVSAYPTFIIIQPDGTEVGRVVGGVVDPAKFIEKIENAINPEKNPNLILNKFVETGEMKYAYEYIDTLRATNNRGKIREFIKEYYHNIPESELYSKKFWGVTQEAISVRDYTVLEYILQNKLEYDKHFGKSNVDRDLSTLLWSALTTYVYEYETCTFSKENVQKAYMYYLLLNSKLTPWEEYIIRACQALSNKDYNKFYEMSKPCIIFNTYRFMECNIIKYRIAANPGLTQEQKEKFKEEFAVEQQKIVDRINSGK